MWHDFLMFFGAGAIALLAYMIWAGCTPAGRRFVADYQAKAPERKRIQAEQEAAKAERALERRAEKLLKQKPHRNVLPAGFVSQLDEELLFSDRAKCRLPSTHTSTFGGVIGPFFGGDSTSRIVTGPPQRGVVTITTRRIIVHAGSTVMEWPAQQITSAFAQRLGWRWELHLRVGNVGAAVFELRDATKALGATQHAIARAQNAPVAQREQIP